MNNGIKKNLINLRKEKSLTQAEISGYLRISVRQYQALEAGTSNGSMKVWRKLSDLFNKPIDYLLEQEAEEPPKE